MFFSKRDRNYKKILIVVSLLSVFITFGKSYALTEVRTLQQLQDMNNNLAENYVLINDIDASPTRDWNTGAGFVPVGKNFLTPFTGSFDGNGHVISNLFINRPDSAYIGLFGYFSNGGTMKNVTLTNITISGKSSVGGLVGQADRDEYNRGQIYNCSISGSIIGTGSDIGGISGFTGRDIKNCSNSAVVTGVFDVGGITGKIGSSNIENCMNTGTINGSGTVGGIAGLLNSGGSIRNCYNSGIINGDIGIGGLAGTTTGAEITDSFNSGDISGDSLVGGGIGRFYNDYSASEAVRCFSSGHVSGNSNIGGFVGGPALDLATIIVTNCYWDTGTSGTTVSDGGEGRTTFQMIQQSNYTNWDFDSIWMIFEYQSYPFLRNVSYSTDISIIPPPSDTVTNGSVISYSLQVNNAGAWPALDIVLTNVISSWISDPEYSTNNGAYWNSWTGLLNIDSIGPGLFQEVLIRGVVATTESTINNTASVSFNGEDTDDGNNSTTHIINLKNSAPVIEQAGPLSVAMDEDGAPTAWIAPVVSATDVDGDTLTWSVVPAGQASHGTAVIEGIGSSPTNFSYTPNPDYNGTDNFEIQIADGKGGVKIIQVDIIIDAVNDAPVNTISPSMVGTGHVGLQLTANAGAWNDLRDGSSVISYTYQWQRADSDQGLNTEIIVGEVNFLYMMQNADHNKYIQVVVTATDNGVGLPAQQSSVAYSGWLYVVAVTDSDDDGLLDVEEDLDSDGLLDPGETDPENPDTDGDTLPDGWEVDNGLKPRIDDANLDYDYDGWTNIEEFSNGTEPDDETSSPDNSVPGRPDTDCSENTAEVQSLKPVLYLINSSDADGHILTYSYEIYSDQEMSLLTANGDNITEGVDLTGWDVPVDLLSDNTSYYWRAQACDPFDCSGWSQAREFFVNLENTLPSIPGISSPANDSNSVIIPTLQVTNANDTDYDSLVYEFQISSDSLWNTMAQESGSIAEGENGTTSWTVETPLEDNTYYWWRARAVDDEGGAGEWAEAGFLVNMGNNLPSSPGVHTPAHNEEVAYYDVDLVIINSTDLDGDTLIYSFEIDTINTFNSPDLVTVDALSQGINDHTTWSLTDLDDNTIYYWRARAFDINNAGSSWCTASFFVNLSNDVPELPTISYPANNSKVESYPVELSVNISSDPDMDLVTYEFELFSEDDLDTHIELITSQETICQVAAELENDNRYYWRFRAVDEHGADSEWSEMSSFYLEISPQGSSVDGSSGSNGSVSCFIRTGEYQISELFSTNGLKVLSLTSLILILVVLRKSRLSTASYPM